MFIDELQETIREGLRETRLSASRASILAVGEPGAIGRIFEGRAPSYERACKILNTLQMEVSINKRTDIPLSPEEFELEHALIPRLDIRVAAGSEAMNEYESVTSHLAFRREWLHSRGLDPHHLSIIEVAGDSMEPLLRSGETILVDTSKKKPADGELVVAHIDDGLIVKRTEQLDKRWWLMSDNPHYKPIKLRPQHRIIGHVANWRAGKIHEKK